MNINSIITADNIKAESYYNLCRLQNLTRFADPIGAIETLKGSYQVTRDDCGNIKTAAYIAPAPADPEKPADWTIEQYDAARRVCSRFNVPFNPADWPLHYDGFIGRALPSCLGGEIFIGIERDGYSHS